ncbi:MAG: PilZ domain-containing protein [Treponema sp.]|jgi:hypothetical protein|nr:PilZ domain-containing protein [Treponema sp.]
MAVPVKRIEKEFFLKRLYDERIPIVHHKSKNDVVFRLIKPPAEKLHFKADSLSGRIRLHKKMDLVFEYQGQVFSFSIKPQIWNDDSVTADAPLFIYKNLDRTFSRVLMPANLDVSFSVYGDRYALSYPTAAVWESGEIEHIAANAKPKNLQSLKEQLTAWIAGCADGHQITLFHNTHPGGGFEERLVAATGKALFIPSTNDAFIETESEYAKNIVTAEVFRAFSDSVTRVSCVTHLARADDAPERTPGQTPGQTPCRLGDAAALYLETRRGKGIASELWVPIIFYDYIIGCIHLWIKNESAKKRLDHNALETARQFARIFVYSLKVHSYFEEGRVQPEPFYGEILDISASGLLFASSAPAVTSALRPGAELALRLSAPGRTICCSAVIARQCADETRTYCGCAFSGLAPEDLRFLFEFLYGKTFGDTALLAGGV